MDRELIKQYKTLRALHQDVFEQFKAAEARDDIATMNELFALANCYFHAAVGQAERILAEVKH